ncbi:MAG: anti-anti-sigma factor [Moraxellaceae bacterium]|nr:MAG: anti-anti-sigma factor [Moraxellaceae bacterium]
MSTSNAQYAVHDGSYVIKLSGNVRMTLCAELDSFVETMLGDAEFSGVLLDLTHATAVDSTTLGLFAKIALGCAEKGQEKPLMACSAEDVLLMVKSMGLGRHFVIIGAMPDGDERFDASDLRNLPQIDSSQQEVCRRVLEAHQILIKLDENNQHVFRDVVALLEKEQQMGKGLS